jgi:hypothetical protein
LPKGVCAQPTMHAVINAPFGSRVGSLAELWSLFLEL